MRNFLSYNIHDGGLEAIVYGYRDGILSQELYNQISQCDSLEDMKVHLAQSTDYGNFLQNETHLSPKVIHEYAQRKLVDEFSDIRRGADQPLGKFLDFITYEYMITNVLKLIHGARNGREALGLLYTCHPLGWFERMEALLASTSLEDMYETVLVDSPLAPFFTYTKQEEFDEVQIEKMHCRLQKNYLEAFYNFCRDLGGETWDVMSTILEFEADRFVITITRNTYGMKGELHEDERKRLYPAFGQLADIHDELARVDNDDTLKEKLRNYPEFLEIVSGDRGLDSSAGSKESLEKRFNERSVELHRASLQQQFQYGVFYSWLKLKEMEVNNLMWISECIFQNMKSKIPQWLVVIN